MWTGLRNRDRQLLVWKSQRRSTLWGCAWAEASRELLPSSARAETWGGGRLRGVVQPLGASHPWARQHPPYLCGRGRSSAPGCQCTGPRRSRGRGTRQQSRPWSTGPVHRSWTLRLQASGPRLPTVVYLSPHNVHRSQRDAHTEETGESQTHEYTCARTRAHTQFPLSPVCNARNFGVQATKNQRAHKDPDKPGPPLPLSPTAPHRDPQVMPTPAPCGCIRALKGKSSLVSGTSNT